MSISNLLGELILNTRRSTAQIQLGFLRANDEDLLDSEKDQERFRIEELRNKMDKLESAFQTSRASGFKEDREVIQNLNEEVLALAFHLDGSVTSEFYKKLHPIQERIYRWSKEIKKQSAVEVGEEELLRPYQIVDHYMEVSEGLDSIKEALSRLAVDPYLNKDAKKITQEQLKSTWRVRVGDLRILYVVDEATKRVGIIRIANRKSVYKKGLKDREDYYISQGF